MPNYLSGRLDLSSNDYENKNSFVDEGKRK
jgi:hypothetical protein